MKNTLLILSTLLVIIFTSCRDDFETVSSTGNLSFSKDTVYLDTVFTNTSSSTYRLKVYNRSDNNIVVPNIDLEKGINSKYRLNVDGTPGQNFKNIEILAKDSIYIFIETTVDINSTPNPLYTDRILFDNGNNPQDVDLVTLVQDAVFLFPSKNADGIIETINLGNNNSGEPIEVQGFYLPDNTTFTNVKPYVIYGFCGVPETKTLTVDPGAKIYFHNNSGIVVDKNASIKINGEFDNQVLIEGDRLEHDFSDIPGQWDAIWLRAGSVDNEINYTTIKNATSAIIIDSISSSNINPTLTIKNSQIYNSANFGLLGRGTNLKGENLVINNSGLYAVACTGGGDYEFTHSTIANYWQGGLRTTPALLIDNNLNTDTGDQPQDLNKANFTNCIIYGSNNIEFLINKSEGKDFNFKFKNCQAKFNDFSNQYDDNPLYDFTNTTLYENMIFNEEPLFKNTENNEMIVGENSPGNDKADTNAALGVPNDILNIDRTSKPDIGAYQHIIFED